MFSLSSELIKRQQLILVPTLLIGNGLKRANKANHGEAYIKKEVLPNPGTQPSNT